MDFWITEDIASTMALDATVINSLVYAYVIESNLQKMENISQKTNETISDFKIYKESIKKCILPENYNKPSELRHDSVGEYMRLCIPFIDDLNRLNVNNINSVLSVTPIESSLYQFYLHNFLKEYMFQTHDDTENILIGSCDVYLGICVIKKIQTYILSQKPELVDIALAKIQQIQKRIYEVTSPDFEGRDKSDYELIIKLTKFSL